MDEARELCKNRSSNYRYSLYLFQGQAVVAGISTSTAVPAGWNVNFPNTLGEVRHCPFLETFHVTTSSYRYCGMMDNSGTRDILATAGPAEWPT